MAGGITQRLAAAGARIRGLLPRQADSAGAPPWLAGLRRRAVPLSLAALLALGNAALFVLAPRPETEVSVAVPALTGRIGGDEAAATSTLPPAGEEARDIAGGAGTMVEPAMPDAAAEPSSPARLVALPPFEPPAVPSLPERRRPPLLASLPLLNQAQGLPQAPFPDLVEQAPEGPLPRVAPDGRAPWRAYARPVDAAAAGRPRIAVIVAGLGLDSAVTEAVIAKTPAAVTLAFSPYSPDLQHWIGEAREAGHEVLLGLPVQSAAFPARDAGPLRLRPGEEDEKLLTRLRTVLAKGGGYVGVLAPPDGALDDDAMARVLGALRARGLMYVGAHPPAVPQAPPSAPVDVRLDRAPFRDALAARLQWLQEAARARGYVVAVTEPAPVVLHHLAQWLPMLADDGLSLVPVSAIPEVEVRS